MRSRLSSAASVPRPRSGRHEDRPGVNTVVPKPREDRPASVGRCVLVADDDATMRDVLRCLLTDAGYTVLLAATGREAVNLASNLEASLAIVDLAMPDGNGLQTCAALRQLPYWRNVPIFVLTHHATDKAIKAALQAGANGFIGKPFVPAELLQRIAGYTGGQTIAEPEPRVNWSDLVQPVGESGHKPAEPRGVTGRQTAAPAARGPSFVQQQAVLQIYRRLDLRDGGDRREFVVAHDERPRILLGEPHPGLQASVRQALESDGCVVDVADDGQKALAMFIRNDYDVVLTNVRLPVIGGIEMAHAIRALPGAKRHKPIIALADSAAHLLRQDLVDAGVNDWLVAPVAIDGLRDCIRRHVPDPPDSTVHVYMYVCFCVCLCVCVCVCVCICLYICLYV